MTYNVICSVEVRRKYPFTFVIMFMQVLIDYHVSEELVRPALVAVELVTVTFVIG